MTFKDINTGDYIRHIHTGTVCRIDTSQLGITTSSSGYSCVWIECHLPDDSIGVVYEGELDQYVKLTDEESFQYRLEE